MSPRERMPAASEPVAPVHVVVLNYNGWLDTIECLESVLRSDYPNTRVIVVDNASTDGSMGRMLAWATGKQPFEKRAGTPLSSLSWPPITKPLEYRVIDPAASGGGGFPQLTFVTSQRNGGFGSGNNHALRLLLRTNAEGYFLLLNNDTVIAKDAVSALVRAISRDERIAAVGGVLLHYDRPDVVQGIGGGRMTRLGMTRVKGEIPRHEVRAPARLDYVTGACMLARIRTLDDIGLYDETFFLYGEDGDWGKRIRDLGYRLDCALDAFVWHKGSSTVGARSTTQDYHLVRSMLHYVRKHTPYLSIPALAYSFIRVLGPKIVRRQWLRARSVLKAYADHVRA